MKYLLIISVLLSIGCGKGSDQPCLTPPTVCTTSFVGNSVVPNTPGNVAAIWELPIYDGNSHIFAGKCLAGEDAHEVPDSCGRY